MPPWAASYNFLIKMKGNCLLVILQPIFQSLHLRKAVIKPIESSNHIDFPLSKYFRSLSLHTAYDEVNVKGLYFMFASDNRSSL